MLPRFGVDVGTGAVKVILESGGRGGEGGTRTPAHTAWVDSGGLSRKSPLEVTATSKPAMTLRQTEVDNTLETQFT